MPTLAQLIAQRARVRGLDPNAVLAVAAGEGLSGGIGDQGRSYGPFQLFTQGAFPKAKLGLNPQQRQAWATSQEGVDYALDRMSFARGLRGETAAEAIIRRFERPADPNTSVARARARLRSGNFGGGGSALLPPPASLGAQQPPGASQRRGLDPALASVFASNAALLGVPSPDPSLLTEPAPRQKLGRLDTPDGALPVVKDFGGRTTPRAQKVLKLAQQYLGTPYVWGGEKPGGFDCSGLVQYLWQRQGVKVPRTSQEQFKVGRKINSLAGLRPGDSVFFHDTGGGPTHMGLFIGNGQFLHAPHTGDVVKISRITDPYYKQSFAGGRRVA